MTIDTKNLRDMHERGTIRRGHIDQMLDALERKDALLKQALDDLTFYKSVYGSSGNTDEAIEAITKELTP
jgi:hypothetical protein